ncbi:HAD domain-containing protein [Photobacterium leiognathi]|uniref:HAD domain-containing protein n=1 Tax=Photobacterium leiognathi TaxID=553611 RepID=UPI002981592A|nr:HAD domain-containing protein [Photobacterium leiognathi]
MKNYNIYSEGTGRYKAVKEGKSANGVFVTTLSASCATAAIERFKRLDIKRSVSNSDTSDLFADPDLVGDAKVVFCDFNGVLDDNKSNLECNEWCPSFRLPLVVDEWRLFEVTRLAVNHNARLVMTSEWRKSGVNFYNILKRIQRKTTNDTYKKFFTDNRKLIRDLCSDATDVLSSRDEEIKKYVRDNSITLCVVFEDDHPISEELNPIVVTYPGLNSTDIERAEVILSKNIR